MKNQMNYTLGIDMGVASIGWAVVSVADKFIDSGVRIFPAGLDNFNSSKEKHPNQDRRISRGARRRIRRRSERKKLISNILKDLGWMPKNEDELQEWYNLNVYELRSRAISEKISLLELGRIILHFNQRRGFLSLRKTEEVDGDKETQGMLGEISALQKAIDESGHKTLGNYLYHIYKEERHLVRLRNQHTRRSMYYDEFSLIWETQSGHHSELNDQLRYGSLGELKNPTKVITPVPRVKAESMLQQFGFENLTFFQRRVYWPASSIGKCELEEGEPRSPIADRRFQEFRMLQEVNNLKILDNSADGKPEERKLTEEERLEAIAYLTGKKEAKLEALKKHLCKKILDLPSHTQITFNLESGGRTKISATSTDAAIATPKAFGKTWYKLTPEIQNKVVEALTIPAAIDEDIREALTQISELDVDTHDALLRVSLPSSYGHLSIIALEKLLPHMRKGMIYMAKDESDSALHAAGYKRRDEFSHAKSDLLPSFDSLLDSGSPNYDKNQVEINNPVVKRALTELRKVVNGLIRKYGKPTRIHVEMARNLKMSPKQRQDYERKTRQHEKERSAAKDAIENLGIIANHTAIQMYRLWKEQKEVCVYTGKSIGISQLFSGEIDIDHIFPFSNSADNSYLNKVVCFRNANAAKGQQIPYHWLTSNPTHYEEVLQRAKSLPRGKYKKFIAEEIPEGFVNRDLNDTSWMAKAARQYLCRIVDKPHHVIGTKGQHTSTLRNQWELHSLLRNDGLDIKNRDDHRHHALDAIVIALCDQSAIQKITGKLHYDLLQNEAKETGKTIYRLKLSGDKLELPWQKFRLDVADSLNEIWVSHRPKRKVSGKLHEDFNYGPTNINGVITRRKKLIDLSNAELKDIIIGKRNVIRDTTIEILFKEYLIANGVKNNKELKDALFKAPFKMDSGVKVEKVRILIPNKTAVALRETNPKELVIPGNTHHLAIFSLGDGNFHFEAVTLYEASRRQRSKEEVIRKTYSDMPIDAEFIFYLCSDDSMMAEVGGKDELFIFKGIHATQFTAKFIYHNDARKNNAKDPITNKAVSIQRTCKPTTFGTNFRNARKVTILPTGEVRNMS